jgi:hypothetical protein
VKSQRNDVFGKPNLFPLAAKKKKVGGRGGNHVVGWVRQNDIFLMCIQTVSVRYTDGWDIRGYHSGTVEGSSPMGCYDVSD